MKKIIPYKWTLVALLCGVALLNYMDRQMFSTMRPSMQASIPEMQSATYFGYLMAIFLWVYGCMSPVSGMVADRFNRKWIIAGSLLVGAIVDFTMGYASSYQQVYCLRAIMGVSEALYIPAGLSLIAEYHDSKTRSLAIGIHMTGIYTGQALGGFGATVAAHFSWHTSFHSFGIICAAYSLLLLLFLKENIQKQAIQTVGRTVSKSPHLLKGLPILLSNLSFWLILFYFAMPSIPGWAAKNWVPTLFAGSLHIPMSEAGPMATITIAIASLIGVITGGILSDRWVQVNIRGRIFTGAIGLGFTIPGLLMLGFGHTLFFVMGAAFCFGFGYGMFDANNMPILCQFVSAKYRATAYGLMNMTGVFFGAFITNILGKSTDAGNLGRDFALLAVIVLLTLVVQLVFLKPVAIDFTND